MKEMLKKLGVQVAVNSALVAVDEVVRQLVAHTFKSHVNKNDTTSNKK